MWTMYTLLIYDMQSQSISSYNNYIQVKEYCAWKWHYNDILLYKWPNSHIDQFPSFHYTMYTAQTKHYDHAIQIQWRTNHIITGHSADKQSKMYPSLISAWRLLIPQYDIVWHLKYLLSIHWHQFGRRNNNRKLIHPFVYLYCLHFTNIIYAMFTYIYLKNVSIKTTTYMHRLTWTEHWYFVQLGKAKKHIFLYTMISTCPSLIVD